MSISEGGPRPGTMTARIYEGFISGRPRVEIFTGLELTGNPNKGRRASLLDHISSHHVKDEQRGQFAAWRAADKPNRPEESYRTDKFRFNLSKGKGGTLTECWPLFLRELPTESIVQITGFRRFQVASCLGGCRRNGFLKRPTEEERREIYGNKKNGKRIYSPEESNAFAFARSLQEASLITADLTNWQELRKLYGQRGRELPQSFADRLRLEVFYIGVKTLLEKGREEGGGILTEYGRIGREIDEDWFRNSLLPQQKFIIDTLKGEWALRRAAENTNGNQIMWREPFLGGRDEAVRAAIRARQRPQEPWLIGDKWLREARSVLTDESNDRGGDPQQ